MHFSSLVKINPPLYIWRFNIFLHLKIMHLCILSGQKIAIFASMENVNLIHMNENEIKLTDKQKRFCYEYCIDFNATQAAIRAGYSIKTANVIGSENLSKPYIQSKIKNMQDNLAITAGISALKIINEHAKIAFSGISNLKDDWMTFKEFESLTEAEKACIQEIYTKEGTRYDADGKIIVETWVKIKLFDKQKSLDSISNMLGFNSPAKPDLSSNEVKITVEIVDPA